MSRNALIALVAILGITATAAVTATVTLVATRNDRPANGTKDVGPARTAGAEARPVDQRAAGQRQVEQPAGTGIFVNDRELSAEQVEQLRQVYGAVAPKGRYWYDPKSGLFGYWGFEAAGYLRPGHDFGPLAATASRGNTGIFLNGREINLTEAGYFQRIFGVVYQGRYWLDGETGYLGVEGNPTPIVNLVAAVRQAQQAARGGSEYHWRDGSGAVVGGEGNCTFAAIPGAPVYSTPGCG
jgi:hypothetical protein